MQSFRSPRRRALAGVWRTLIACLVGACVVPQIGFAADFPSKVITMVIPFAPGGGTDVVGRLVAEALGETLSQTVVVLNRSGAAGVLGTQYVKDAPADGYTLMFTSQSVVTQTYEADSKVSHKDFTMLGMVNQDAFGLAVEQNAKWHSLQEFIADAKKRPGALSVGTTGIGSATFMQIPLLEKAASIELNPIPYNGSAGFQTALMSRTIDAAGVVVGDAAGLLKSGKIRMLGIMSANRLDLYPDVPTYRELGVNIDFIFWRGLFVRNNTPAPIVAVLRAAVAKVANSQAFKDKMIRASFIPANVVAEAETQAFIHREEGLVEEVQRSLQPAK